MSVKFLSDEWADALARACNADPRFVKAIRGQEAVLQVEVRESPATPVFTLVYGNDVLRVLTEPTPTADITMALDYQTMVDISRGECSGPEAMAEGKMAIEGDMGKVFGLIQAQELIPEIEGGLGLEY